MGVLLPSAGRLAVGLFAAETVPGTALGDARRASGMALPGTAPGDSRRAPGTTAPGTAPLDSRRAPETALPGTPRADDQRAPGTAQDYDALAPETALVAGWGAYCLFMTAWAVTTKAPLTFAFAPFALATLAGLFRRTAGAIPWRAVLLSVPLLLVLLPARPSQVDTWLNLLPNLAYLADHASLPADGGPQSWSFLPAAPYNTQFVGYGMSVLAGHLADNALSLFNALLMCAAGLHLARVCGRAPDPRRGAAPNPGRGWPALPPVAAPQPGSESSALPPAAGWSPKSGAGPWWARRRRPAPLPSADGLPPDLPPGADAWEKPSVAVANHQGSGSQPGWWACAAGFLLAVPLNPGFTPRVFFASYGEAPLAVALMFAVALGADLFAAARAGAPCGRKLAALALVLAALVEIKQSALGLLLPLIAGLLLLGLAAPSMRRGRWATMIAAASAPALLLYLAWRWYVLGNFAVGELKMLPLAEWHLNLLPQIFAGIAFAIFQKATYFALVLALLAAAVLEARRRPWGQAAVVLALGAALVAGFNAFLLFTYVAHFPAVWAVKAHSYFRYMSQLSLVVVLGLATWLQPAAAAWFARRTPGHKRGAARGAVALAAMLPLATAPLLRFDLDAPQPLLWTMARSTAALLHDGDRLALVVPGDGDDAAGSLLRGVLLFTPPRLPHLDFRSELSANQAALDDAHAHGYDRALVTCAPAGLGGLGAGQAGLVAYAGGTWRPMAAWALPAGLRRERFSAMLPHSVFCK